MRLAVDWDVVFGVLGAALFALALVLSLLPR